MKNVLIIGGGIAGGSLALQLIEQNINVTVLDRGQNYSSVIASGMVNPMVFRRMNLSWRAAEMLPYARSFYNDLEQKFGIEFLADLKIRRFFSSDQERGYWEKKQHQSGYNDFLTVHSDFHKQVPNAKSEFGSGLVKSAFWIRSEVFMTGLHDYLSEQGVLNTAFFNENLFNASKLTYCSEKYDAVVFCCGSANNKISFFEPANIQYNRGQILELESKELPEGESWNRKGFLLPLGSNKFKLGATYEWNEPELSITTEAREKLEVVIQRITDLPYKVVGQQVGMRPTVVDRRPVLGMHPKHKGLFIFNGLGTKGYMMAPLLSKEMVDFMLKGTPLHKEVEYARFIK
jgi:glycine oxidase